MVCAARGRALPALHGQGRLSRDEVAYHIVAAGLGLAIVPQEAAAPQAAAHNRVLLPLAEDWAERRFVICSRSESTLSASAWRLAEHLANASAS
ncbi:MAG: LysR substrate-binding domain-containing protein [Burkholderiaceae bacterium]